MKEYSWGIYKFKQDANKVGQELEKLGNELTPQKVVEVARDENNVLHDMFEWNDAIASQKYREQQASQIICSIQVNIIKDEEETKKVRAFVTLRKNTSYKTIESVVKDTDGYALLLEKAYSELCAIRKKYNILTEIQELLADIPEKE